MTDKDTLVSVWEEHLRCEFELKNAEDVMQTMVANPYINHMPTLTGGAGYDEVYHFYKYHFIPKVPIDTKLHPISRTVGDAHLVDEFILTFTHDREIDFMLPGIQPTQKFVVLPHMVIVYFENAQILAEHIYWDQGSLLAQIGLLSNDLPVINSVRAKQFLLGFRAAMHHKTALCKNE